MLTLHIPDNIMFMSYNGQSSAVWYVLNGYKLMFYINTSIVLKNLLTVN